MRFQGAPVFSIEGNAEGINARAHVMRVRAGQWADIARSLQRISTDGWSGRAARRFQDRFRVEPERWYQASDMFTRAASALEGYAAALAQAQQDGRECANLYARGEMETLKALHAYEQRMGLGRKELAWGESVDVLTPSLKVSVLSEPFVDPGKALRDQAIADFSALIVKVDTQAHACATELYACGEGAPASRNWAQTGLAFVGGVLVGAFETVADMHDLLFQLQYGGLLDVMKLSNGQLTVDELCAKYGIRAQDALDFLDAVAGDPMGSGIEIAKAVLDWDTWVDDPARALGHLVPDMVLALATGGAGAAATRGVSTAGRLTSGVGRVDDALGAARKFGDATHFRNVDKLDDGADSIKTLGRDRLGENARASSILDTPGNRAPTAPKSLDVAHSDPAGSTARRDTLTPASPADNAVEVTTRKDATVNDSPVNPRHDASHDNTRVERSNADAIDSGSAGILANEKHLPGGAVTAPSITRLDQGAEALQADHLDDTLEAPTHTRNEADHARTDDSHTAETTPQTSSDPHHLLKDPSLLRPGAKGADILDGTPKYGVDREGNALNDTQEWLDEYSYRHEDKTLHYHWPEPSALPGTERTLTLDEFVREFGDTIDRVGDSKGRWFSPVVDGRPYSFQERAIPADSLGKAYNQMTISSLPDGWTVEVSTASPGMGYPGGATQIQFRSPDGEIKTMAALKEAGIIQLW
ncbi:putative T7SS-secreted protein [Schaalia suimastitidis]|uniref:putative T7SS-secreted protein n=1 Tax=Schaalia suimastitidis TaxID=121163 RepID=UPI001969AA77|nr:glycohydrolase toxin TNT-related protein [Schaalia suimastitidis]